MWIMGVLEVFKVIVSPVARIDDYILLNVLYQRMGHKLKEQLLPWLVGM